jgi:hypothetical protein
MRGMTEEKLQGPDVPDLGDLNELCKLGRILDEEMEMLGGKTPGVFLAEALLKIRDRRGDSIPLVPNRVQREYERCRGRRNIVLKARQLGVSTWVAGRLFLKTITRPGTLTVQVAHTQEAAEGLFQVVHRFVDHLPESLRRGPLRRSRSSARQIVFPTLDSEYRVESAGDSNAGRGITIQNLHCSEVARWPGNAAETLAGLRAAMPPEGELVLESTPNGADGCFYDEWKRAEETRTVRHFFPWWWEDAYATDVVADAPWTDEERALVEKWGLRREQIAFRRQIAGGLHGLARQEYAEDAEECFLSSGACIFDLAAVDARMRELPERVDERLGGRLLVWFSPVAGREYVMGVDPAGGGQEGDYSTAQVVDLGSGLQCAELQAKFGTLELAEQVADLARRYNHARLAVERNNHGSGVLAYLKGVFRYTRLYHQGGQAGWLTTSVSRPAMLGRLGAALVECPRLFQSRRLLQECRTFVRHANGRTEAQAGAHDDCVMAMAVAMAVRAEILESGSRRS